MGLDLDLVARPLAFKYFPRAFGPNHLLRLAYCFRLSQAFLTEGFGALDMILLVSLVKACTQGYAQADFHHLFSIEVPRALVFAFRKIAL